MTKLRIGVIGLGRRWRRRYGPALRALRERFTVRAVSDPASWRAEREAKHLGCTAAAGPTELLERDDIDAVLLVGAPWYGLWPLELACRYRKPVFCGASLDVDEGHADAICRQVGASGLPVMMEMAPRFAAATWRLRELLQTRLGAPRLVLYEEVGPKPRSVRNTLLDWCAFLLGAAPIRIQAASGGGTEEVFLEFSDGRAARFSRWSAPEAGRARRIQVAAERGTAWVLPPDQLEWADAAGRHALTPRSHRPVGEVLLEHFHGAVTHDQPLAPSLEDAARALRWAQAAAQSRAEGRRIELGTSPA
jgi:myo-inositol 2-dehydrogenase/D-chiro-inositol 1-dehydrogenase